MQYNKKYYVHFFYVHVQNAPENALDAFWIHAKGTILRKSTYIHAKR